MNYPRPLFPPLLAVASLLPGIPSRTAVAQDWRPAEFRLKSRWADEVSPGNVNGEYPRPQLVRSTWQSLNGLWEYAIHPRQVASWQAAAGQILVPFPVESSLSGVAQAVAPDQRLWYRRQFRLAEEADEGRVLLHFGAVDWEATVLVNGQQVGQHRGGYDSFSFDITDALKPDGVQELIVAVWDPTDTEAQARGKQVLEPHGIWYTAVTGIWQTVWLERVPAQHIASLEIVPDVDARQVQITVEGSSAASQLSTRVVINAVRRGDQTVPLAGPSATAAVGEPMTVPLDDLRLWSPDDPWLYDCEVTLLGDGRAVDSAKSYFGMRKISLGSDERGFRMLLLNGKPLFQFGPLDQGWWPDGLYTAPTDEALRYDVEITKRLGFNMLRKHVKVEPERFYLHCDQLGVLVWQDMPSGFTDDLRVEPTDSEDAARSAESAAQFERELAALIEGKKNHPSIVCWVPFNEGWGQYETRRITQLVRQLDPTRLSNPTSGWTDRQLGDMFDAHIYPGPGMEEAEQHRATVLGEFGGLGWPVQEHLWWNKRNWGYRTFDSRQRLNDEYRQLIFNLYPLLGKGLAAAIYTQTTDVEGEVNGLMTYDRSVLKYDEAVLRQLHARLYQSSPRARTILADAESAPQTWRYRQDDPGEGWFGIDFDDSDWSTGAAGFGAGESPFMPVRTAWNEPSLWLRRQFDIESQPDVLALKIYLQAPTAQVYLNGEQVADLSVPRRRHYYHVNLTTHRDLLRPQRNVLAVRVSNDGPNRSCDAGLYGIWNDR